MRKIFSLLILTLFCAISFNSCTEDDLQFTVPEQIILQERSERFFFYESSGDEGKTASSFDVNIIHNLKLLNDSTNFICNLSDQKGLPKWNYTYTNLSFIGEAKDGEEQNDFLIIPMMEEGASWLTSLLFIDYYTLEDPVIYTITNNELYLFVKNEEVDLHKRESVLMTFFYFDQQIFGTERRYTNIPLELFENIPEVGIDEHLGHNHNKGKTEEGYGYKEFDFEIKDQSMNGGSSSKYAMMCIDFFHCAGCQGACDLCRLCVSTECYTFGGGGGLGSGGGNSGENDPPGSGGGGNGGNNAPWYSYYPEYQNYHPKFQIILEKLDNYNVRLHHVETKYLDSIGSSQFFQQFNSYLSNNTSEKSLFVRGVATFLTQNKDVVQSEKIMERIANLEQYLYDNPYAISNIPCNQIPLWQEVAQHQVPTSVKNKLQNLDNAHISPYYGWALQNIEKAKGSLVNNDYFSVTFSTMPYKPFPHQNEMFTPEEFLNFVRRNINDFIDTSYSSFSPSNQTGYNEGGIWYSNNPMEAIIHINIPGDDGSVITSGYQISYSAPPFNNFLNGNWMFTTIKTPFGFLTQGLDGPHPVSGNRKFGLTRNQNGSYTFYTRGVDRVTDGLDIALIVEKFKFSKADNLWQSLQQGIKNYIQNNSYGNVITVNTPVTWRPKYDEIKDVLIKNKPLSTLECN